MAKTYDIFISHSWTYRNHYERFIEFFESDLYFYYRNYSVPKDDPIHNAPNQSALYEAIKRQIAPVNVYLVAALRIATRRGCTAPTFFLISRYIHAGREVAGRGYPSLWDSKSCRDESPVLFLRAGAIYGAIIVRTRTPMPTAFPWKKTNQIENVSIICIPTCTVKVRRRASNGPVPRKACAR